MTAEERNALIEAWMGKPVRVAVDRPIGYRHWDMVYPINYGYIPGVMAGDGEEQDAYILGVHEPVDVFDGVVVGAIRRKNDAEDKLVVAPPGMRFHQGQIAQAVAFQEQYFVSTIDSLLRRSCGVIPFREREGQREYLIVLQTNNCWSFPKGHMEAGEREEETALRELREETGLEAQLIPGKQVVLEYDIPPFSRKQVVLFLGRVAGMVVPQAEEVTRYRWTLATELADYLHPDTWEACKGILKGDEL